MLFCITRYAYYNQNHKLTQSLISCKKMMHDDTSLPVQLHFSARSLKDTDFISKSDPFLRFSMQKTFYGNIQVIGQTEVIPNTVHPNWLTKIPVQYYFEMQQPVVIQVFDKDSGSNADFIGKSESSLGAIMGAHHQTIILDLVSAHGKHTGKVIIRGEKVEQSSHSLMMKWRGIKIANMDSHFNFIDKSDPYLKFLKIRDDNTFIQVARTQVLDNNQEPEWKPIQVPAARLFKMNHPLASFKVQCWDHEKQDHKHQFIGEAFVKVQDLKTKQPPFQYQLYNVKKKKPGKLSLDKYQLVATPNFVDYLQSGLQINMVAAIDFTGSNGVPKNAESLHYLGNQPTQYQQVLKSIWDIIQNYDSDKRIPAFGFGAKPHFPNINQNVANHCFPINDNPNNPEIQGFGNLMNCYVQAVSNMQFSGPTYFQPLLKQSFSVARQSKGYNYQILLILTDGQIHDMGPTKDIIFENANLPMSIIIVGIGNANFGKMIQLDGDGGLINSQGKRCPRDIVQFVPYNKFQSNARMLAQELLKEIPKQVTQYFRMMGRFPQPVKGQSLNQVLPPH